MRRLDKEDIYFHNDFVENLVDNPESVSEYTKYSQNQTDDNYQLLFYSALNSHRGYKIFDFFLLNMPLVNDISIFERDLYDYGVYYDYVESVVERDDNFLKAYMYTYLCPNGYEDIYESPMDIAKDLVNEGDYKIDYRTNALVNLLNHSTDKKLVSYIKRSIKKLFKEDKYVKTICTDEEIQDCINRLMTEIDNKINGNRLVMEIVK